MVEREFCTGCGACGAVCPRNAIQMTEDRDGFLYPVLNAKTCTECGLCTRVCPLTKAEPPGEAVFFGARAKRDTTRLLGSSGGIFPLLAAAVLEEGGSVWGAAFAEDGTLRHMEICAEADIPKITRTKYIQSSLSAVWERLREAARQDAPVLFCGTPCQTDAVRSFLGAKRDGIFLVDLICYGVPSPGIWRDYKTYLERRYNGAFRSFSFRDKRGRDNGHTCAALLGETEHAWSLYSDLYCRSMFSNVNLRPSCFHCRYCTTERSSDMTLGDFWGIEQVRPGFDDGMGCSAVICRTEAGKRLWERIRPEVEWFACEREEIANGAQPRLREPVRPHPRRQLYMRLRRILPFPVWLRLFRRL